MMETLTGNKTTWREGRKMKSGQSRGRVRVKGVDGRRGAPANANANDGTNSET